MRKLAWGVALPTVILAGFVGLLQLLPSPASPEALADAEARMLSVVKSPLRHQMVQAGSYQLHTVIIGDGSKPPLVMLHGHGGGLAVFAQNFDALAEGYTIYAVELLGWGRSDRPVFEGQTGAEAQAWWVESLEAWRQEMELDQFTLLGHSMGGFVAGSYALAYPEHVAHLILADPGGMSRDVHPKNGIYYNLPPQRIVRLAGPLGPALVSFGREMEVERSPYAEGTLTDYYYQISAAPASGEIAFRKLLGVTEWALPLLAEVEALPMPVTLIWGEGDELVSPENGVRAKELIRTSELIIIPDAAHSPYSETPQAFHDAILNSPFRIR
ncbi:MAG: alpha/beta fold hydrolase [Ardenticatenales bacterium]|nr:alpha/beta fold hydrolase [Ardenticatenales bacterium]